METKIRREGEGTTRKKDLKVEEEERKIEEEEEEKGDGEKPKHVWFSDRFCDLFPHGKVVSPHGVVELACARLASDVSCGEFEDCPGSEILVG